MSDAPAATATLRPSGAPAGPDPLVGRVINERFRIVGLIAKGGMGKVYRAEQAPLGRAVALKVLNPSYSGEQDPEFHRRFFLEASICSKLTHPNTITIFDYGRSDDDVYYIAMELLEGRTLHRALREDGAFPPARALHVARQIARSLREAHALGVIHRDLKPANVFLVRHGDENDFVKVLDFGLVKSVDEKGEDLTQTGLFMGSPKYMSPEQIRGERVDARADVYALGVILYEMLTGRPPFERSSSVNVLMAHVHDPPPSFATTSPNVRVAPGLEALVMRALAKAPEERFPTMDAVLVALKEAGEDAHAWGGAAPSLETGTTGRFGAHPAAGGGSPALTTSSSSGAVVAVPGSSLPPAAADTVSTLPPAAERRRRAGLVALGIAAMLGAAAAAALAFGAGPDAPASPAAGPGASGREPPESPPAPETPPEPRSPPAAPLRTTLAVSSEPPGATVRVGDDTYGPTPIELVWEGERATRGREVEFVFELDGHSALTVRRTISGERLDVRGVLERLPAARPIRPRPARPAPDDDGPIAPIHGYKTDPY